MPWPRFLFWNALGGAAWAISIGVTAYFLGKAAAAVLGVAGLALLTLVVVGGLVVLFVRRLRRPAHEAASATAPPTPD